MSKLQLIVRNIISNDVGGNSRVTISSELFSEVAKAKPELPFTEMSDKAGNRVRRFEIDGTYFDSIYNKDKRETKFVMNTESAKKHLVTWASVLENLPKTEYSLDDFTETKPASGI